MKGFRKYAAMLMVVVMMVTAAGCSPISLLGTIGASIGATIYVVENADEVATHFSEETSKEESSEEEISQEESLEEENSEEEVVVENVDDPAFDAFMKKFFVEMIKEDYISVHVFLTAPEAYGIDLDSMPKNYGSVPTSEDMEQTRQMLSSLTKELKGFDYDSLSKRQQVYYDELMNELNLSMALSAEKFDYYQNLFSQMKGIHYSIASLLSDWVLRSEQDAADLIELIDSTREFIDASLDYVREQQSRGLMSISVEDVSDYCWKILDKGMDSEILRHLISEIDGLGLDEEAAETYRQRVSEAFENSFLPSYRDIVDVLNELDANGENYKRGLWAFPEGKEYYSLLLQGNLGTDLTVEEMMKKLEEKSAEAYSNLFTIIGRNPEAFSIIEGTAEGLPFESYDQMLEVIYSKMGADYPEIGEISYTIDDMEEELASDSGVAAYYNLPPVDGNTINVMKVNPHGDGPEALETFETVAHEGLPGHMYMYNYMKKKGIPEIFYVSGQLAYTEGWAVYTSYQAMDYLGLDPDMIQAYYYMNQFIYYTLLQLDIGIHYMEWEFSDFVDKGTDMGLLDPEDEEGCWAQYLQLQNDPTVFFTYYGGLMQFEELKEKAMSALGDKFDLCDFNEALLQYGPVSFELVGRSVDEYIESHQ